MNSWLGSHGACRASGASGGARRIAMGLAVPGVALLCVWGFGVSWCALVCFVLVELLLVIALVDWDTRTIPNELVLVVLVVAVAGAFAGAPGRTAFDVLVGARALDIGWTSHIIGALCVSVPMLLIALPSGGFGGGDIKLMAAVGPLLGWQLMLLAFAIALVMAAVYALFLVGRHHAGRGTAFAFGPFLAAGITASLFCGNGLIHLYLHALGLA